MLDKIFSTRNLIIFCIVCVLGLIGMGAWLFYSIEQPAKTTTTESTKKETPDLVNQRDKTGGSVSTAKMDEYKKEGLNPFGSSIKINELTDDVYQEYIHGMSHQKVVADVKWGFYQINNERIQWLLDGLEKNNLEYENLYRDILTRWEKGDFSRADEDHNAIWNLQGGTIGKATGILSRAAEEAYVESKKIKRAMRCYPPMPHDY